VSPPVDSEPERILVVEDDEPLRMMITEILSSEGYDVLAFGESKQALDAAPSLGAPVHLLLTDVVMPRIGGREVAERLIALGAVSRVLFMSGYTDESVQDSRALEHSSFIQKPFTTEALLHEVRGLLDGPGLKAERP
jgi:CheY-like chemotaxis protein